MIHSDELSEYSDCGHDECEGLDFCARISDSEEDVGSDEEMDGEDHGAGVDGVKDVGFDEEMVGGGEVEGDETLVAEEEDTDQPFPPSVGKSTEVFVMPPHIVSAV